MKLNWIYSTIIVVIIICTQLIACSSKPDYVGKWETEEGVNLELTEDGHIIYEHILLEAFDWDNPAIGTYEVYGDELIKVSFEGNYGAALRLSDTDTMKLTVKGNTMVVVWDDITGEYKKVK